MTAARAREVETAGNAAVKTSVSHTLDFLSEVWWATRDVIIRHRRPMIDKIVVGMLGGGGMSVCKGSVNRKASWQADSNTAP